MSGGRVKGTIMHPDQPVQPEGQPNLAWGRTSPPHKSQLQANGIEWFVSRSSQGARRHGGGLQPILCEHLHLQLQSFSFPLCGWQSCISKCLRVKLRRDPCVSMSRLANETSKQTMYRVWQTNHQLTQAPYWSPTLSSGAQRSLCRSLRIGLDLGNLLRDLGPEHCMGFRALNFHARQSWDPCLQ